MDPLCTNGLNAEETGSSPSMPSLGKVLFPWGPGQESGCASCLCENGLMSGVRLAAWCVIEEYARMLKRMQRGERN